MPEKFPPFFRQPPNKEKPQPNLQDQPSNQSIYNPGPNLILQEEMLSPHLFYLDIAAKLLRRLSFYIVIAFGIMLIFNIYYNLKLEGQRKMINQLADEVGQYSLVRKEALDIDKKTNFYKKTLTQRNILGDKATDLFSNLNDQTLLVTGVADLDKYLFTLNVSNPFEFGGLISRYLATKHIGTVTLRSADLDTVNGIFKVVLNGTYK